jgi:hypothetical protein
LPCGGAAREADVDRIEAEPFQRLLDDDRAVFAARFGKSIVEFAGA